MDFREYQQLKFAQNGFARYYVDLRSECEMHADSCD